MPPNIAHVTYQIGDCVMNQANPVRPDKVVIVDDDARIRDLLRRYLSQEGFEVMVAEDGKTLNRILQREAVDLIVLDLMLPGEDGLSICRRLRGRAADARRPGHAGGRTARAAACGAMPPGSAARARGHRRAAAPGHHRLGHLCAAAAADSARASARAPDAADHPGELHRAPGRGAPAAAWRRQLLPRPGA